MDKKEISREMFEVKSELLTKNLDEKAKIELNKKYKELKHKLARIMIDEMSLEKGNNEVEQKKK